MRLLHPQGLFCYVRGITSTCIRLWRKSLVPIRPPSFAATLRRASCAFPNGISCVFLLYYTRMNKLSFVLFFSCLLLFGSVSVASAHQPRIVSVNPTVVTEPDVSQAFYGTLTGSPQEFRIQIPLNQKQLYLGVLVPVLPEIKTDVFARVFKDQQLVGVIQSPTDVWPVFHEDFANDDYYQGPEATFDVTAGEYRVEVTRPNDTGKYVLVVGEKESFPPGEIWNAITTLPTLKANFFNKPWWTAFTNKSGMFLGLGAVLVLVGFWLLGWLIRSYVLHKNKKG